MERRVYVRIGLGLFALAAFILPGRFFPPLLSVPVIPDAIRWMQSEIAWAYVIIWMLASACTANAFLVALLVSAPAVRVWRVAVTLTIMTVATIAPITALTMLSVILLWAGNSVSQVTLAKVGAGISIYSLALYPCWRKISFLREFRQAVSGWERWRVVILVLLSCAFMGFLTWMGFIVHFGIMK